MKYRHCLRGLDGKYGGWDEILRDILNGKLKILQNRKQPGSDTEEEDDYYDNEEMPEEIGTPTPKVYDTSERDGRYATVKLHTDGEMTGDNSKTNIRRSTE